MYHWCESMRTRLSVCISVSFVLECVCACVWRCILCAHIYLEFKSLCLITWYSFEEEICFLKGYFSDNWSEEWKFVEAIMKQTKLQSNLDSALLFFYDFTTLQVLRSELTSCCRVTPIHTHTLLNLQLLRLVQSCVWVNADYVMLVMSFSVYYIK